MEETFERGAMLTAASHSAFPRRRYVSKSGKVGYLFDPQTAGEPPGLQHEDERF
jgi:hypothetical protein